MILNIGRNSKNDVVISDSEVSGFHAQIVSDNDNQVFINDLNSQNGTFVNGVQITSPRQLVPGDKVKIAGCPFDWEQHVPSSQSSPENSVKNTNNPINTPKKKSSLMKKVIIAVLIIGGLVAGSILLYDHFDQPEYDLTVDCNEIKTGRLKFKITNSSEFTHNNVKIKINSYNENNELLRSDIRHIILSIEPHSINPRFQIIPIGTYSCECEVLNSNRVSE